MTKTLETTPPDDASATVRVALAGNPNCGKTSLFNALTGDHQHVGNYPGVTVERRAGSLVSGGRRYEVLDLPGTYSLNSFSPEERIAQDALLDDQHDVVIVVADSTALKRSLVLLVQVMQAGANPVLCLNMADEAHEAGQRIDLEQMKTLLGIPIVETVGNRGVGVEELTAALDDAARHPVHDHRLVLGEQLEAAVTAIADQLKGEEVAARGWVATRLLAGDEAVTARVSALGLAGPRAVEEARKQSLQIEAETGQDAAMFITARHFGFVDGLLREVVQQQARHDARATSQAIDAVLVNRYLGLPIFAAVMYFIFWLTFSVGEIPMGWIEAGFDLLGERITALWGAGSGSPLRSLLVDGVIAGVGGVVVFLPNILLLFLGLSVLEDTGYMARVAFLMDRVMHRFGLHGRSFVPMMTGFGCSIPGIMATRTIENERDRLTTIMVLPLMSCGARLPIWMLLIPAFFAPVWRAPALFFIYGFGVLLAFMLALALRSTVLKGEEAPFVMELPPYRLPTWRAVGSRMMERSWIYLRKAGTIILGISILMWFATAFPQKQVFDIDQQVASGQVQLSAEEVNNQRAAEALRYSAAGRLGGAIEPIIAPLGFDWKLGSAMVGAFAAKEVFVAQMGIVYAMGETDEDSEPLRDVLARNYSPLVGISLMLFLLIATPCMATVAVTKRETGSWRWAALQFGGLTAVAYVISLVVYQVGSLLGG